MDSSDHNQSCAICLESLTAGEGSHSSSQQPKIGAVVPCGHVYHSACYRKWHSAQRRRSANWDSNGGTEESFKCKCPMCNNPCDNFVKLYLGDPRPPKKQQSPSSDYNINVENESENIVLLARTCHDSAKRLDRVKDKLKQYKKENRALETKLKEERRVTEETLARTLERHSKERRRQQARFTDELSAERDAKAMLQQELEQQQEDHERERKKWKRHYKKLEQKLVEELDTVVAQQAEQAREWRKDQTELHQELGSTQDENEAMREEINRIIMLQVEERRAREKQMKELQEELETARRDRARASAKVQRAVQGITQMRVYHEIRKDQMEQMAQENAKLKDDIAMMKKAADFHEEILFD